MKWDVVAAIAELVGALGVVATLLYLSLQIRQNTKALRTATFQSIIGFATGFAQSIAQDGELARIFHAGITSFDALDEPERFRFHFQMIALLRRFENILYQSTMGLLDDAEWEGLRASLDAIMVQPGAGKWWALNSKLFNSLFCKFIEGRLPTAAFDSAPQADGSAGSAT